jgi:photosystem II stability/assembly factor-like uncharacterized protein
MRKGFQMWVLVLPCLLVAAPVWGVQVVKQFEETSYFLKDVSFINSSVGWAVGDPHWHQAKKTYVGTIIKTVDGGNKWVPQNAGVSQTLRGVCFVDENNGWAVGLRGVILHTNDGGNHWVRQTVATKEEFRGVVFTDVNHGWATSIKPIHNDWWGDPDAWRGSVWHTDNGGTTWLRQTLPANAGLLNRIEFIDAKHGWVVGIKRKGYDQYGDPLHVGVVYHTVNGGQTWTQQFVTAGDMVFTGIDFVDGKTGWIVGFKGDTSIQGGVAFHTTDGGATWTQQNVAANFRDTLWDVHFLDASQGYAVGFNPYGGGTVYRTLNGGAKWEGISMANMDEGEFLYGVAVFADRVIAVGNHDFLCQSTDPWGPYGWLDGDKLFTQKYINVHYRFEEVFFADENHGWAVGKRSYLPNFWGQVILVTSNGGKTWKRQYQHAPELDGLFEYTYRLDGVSFVDALNGWAVGGSTEICNDDYSRCQRLGAILHTTDGGLHWEQQASELYDCGPGHYVVLEFFATQFLDGRNGWALADAGCPDNVSLARTADGGTTWEWVDTGIDDPLGIGFALVQGGLEFVDALHGWAVGGLGTVIHTEDGGATWEKQELPDVYPRTFAVDFINNQVGWVAGEGLFHTVNGGKTWVRKNTKIEVDFHDIHFTDAINGWIAGSRGVVANTVDGGNTWNLLATKTSFDLLGLSFIGPQKGWAVGDRGAIIAINP